MKTGVFTCYECEFSYEDGITGDSDARTCYSCMSESEEEAISLCKQSLEKSKPDWWVINIPIKVGTIKSIQKVLDMYLLEEERHYYENEEPDDHIYRDFIIIKRLLKEIQDR